MASSKSGGGERVVEMEKLSVEQLKSVKEQTEMEVNVLQDSLNNIRTATNRLGLASSALRDLSLRPQENAGPLTASLYVPGVLDDADNVLVDIGTGYFVEKTMTEGKDYCEWKIDLLKSNFDQLVENFACGGRHAALVTKQGEIFSWGEESGGRLGHGVDSDVVHPKLIDALSNTNIDLVACGGNQIRLKGLVGDPGDEYSAALRTAIRCIMEPNKYFAKVLKHALNGNVPDEESLSRVIVTRAEKDLKEIKELYLKRNNKSLDLAVAEATSGDYKTFLLALLGNPENY